MSNLFNLFPPSPRGRFLSFSKSTTSPSYENVLNIPSGSGKLLFIKSANLVDSNGAIKITVDGLSLTELLHDAAPEHKWVTPKFNTTANIYDLELSDLKEYINIEFKLSLLIQSKRTNANGMYWVQGWFQSD